MLPEHSVLEEAHHVPFLVKILPLVMGLDRHRRSPRLMYIRQPDLPARLAARFQALYRFLLNKWYFDELYDRLFVEPAKRLGLRPLAGRSTSAVIDEFGPDGVAAGALDGRAPRGPPADRLPLPLRLRHADRGRGPGHLVPVRVL